MTYKVALTFEDGLTRFIEVRKNETVADAAYKARINIPFDCRDGACGTCKAFCEAGTFDGGDYIDDAMTEDEAEAGFCLPCQMTPESNLVLRIAGTSEMAKTGAQTFTGTIEELTWLSDTTASLRLSLPNREELAFLPGQYMNVAVLGTDEERSYSFSSGPGDEHLSFLVRTAPNGTMTTYLKERAAVGDTLELDGPRGSFFLRPFQRPTLMLAGGTGIAPILSMLEKTVADGGDLAHPLHLVYGITHDKDLVEYDRVQRLAEALPGFTFDYCASHPDATAPKKGYVTDHLSEEQLNGGDIDVYLCGPPPMVDAVRRFWDTVGITPANMFYERFAVGSTGPATGNAQESRDGADLVGASGRP